MSEYRVEIEATYREIYQVQADSEEDARTNWSDGNLWIAECVSVEGVTSVTLEEE